MAAMRNAGRSESKQGRSNAAQDPRAERMTLDRGAVGRMLHGSGVSSVATGLGLLCHLATITLIARLVEKEVFGTYILILAAAQGAKVLGGLGLDLTLTRRLASDAPPTRPTSFACVAVLRALGLVAICLLLVMAGARLSWLDVSLPAQVGYLVAITVVGSGRELLLSALQGMFEFGLYAYGLVLPAVLRLAGVGLLYATGRGDLTDLLRLEVAVLMVALLAMLGVAPIRRLLAGWALKRAPVRKLVSFSVPLYLNSVLYFLSGRLNLFLLAGFTNPVQVANYGAAWQVPDGCARMLQAVVVAYFPFAAKLSGDANHRGAASLTEFVLALAALGTVLSVVIAALFGPEILTVLFGASYRPAATVFALLMASFALQSLISVMGYSLVAAGHPGVTTTINTFGMLLLLAGGLAAIPVFGAVGAAGALVGANAAVLALSWRALSRRGPRIDAMSFLTPLALGALCVGLGQAVAESIAGRLAIAGLYILMCSILRKELRVSLRFLVSEGRPLLNRLRTMLSP